MKVELIPYYSREASKDFPFWVKSILDDLNGEIIVSNGTSWDEAIAKQRQKLADYLIAPEPPKPFTIEI